MTYMILYTCNYTHTLCGPHNNPMNQVLIDFHFTDEETET